VGRRNSEHTFIRAHVGKRTVPRLAGAQERENTYAERGERTRENIRILSERDIERIYVSWVREKRERILIKICRVAGD
jgi:hypothetical protein